MLLKISQTGKRVILSTGMSTLGEVEAALSVLSYGYLHQLDNYPSYDACKEIYFSKQGQAVLKEKVALLHCTTEYPAPFTEINLRVMQTLRDAFGLPVGYSDHTVGTAVSIAAVALGATIIEKHFTLDKMLPGPDHQASLAPQELLALVTSIRQVELAIGGSVKIPTVSELKNRLIARKSLVTLKNIKKGEKFTDQNIGCKRPGYGLSSFYFSDITGKCAERDYSPDEMLEN